jgi:hypothetical protein
MLEKENNRKYNYKKKMKRLTSSSSSSSSTPMGLQLLEDDQIDKFMCHMNEQPRTLLSSSAAVGLPDSSQSISQKKAKLNRVD